MASNLRAKPIYGVITDSAGNIIRDSLVTIKSFSPSGTIEVNSVNTDDNGGFVTAPLPNGKYGVYCSGVLTSVYDYNATQGTIPAYAPDSSNIPGVLIKNFDSLINGESGSALDINDYRVFIQIEDETIDTVTYGSTFQIHSISKNSPLQLKDLYPYMYSKLYFNNETKITTTRFDVEYYMPITSESNMYKRIKWAGVPGIRYRDDLKTVIALDYYSMVASCPKYATLDGGMTYDGNSGTVTLSGIFDAASVAKGDLVKLVGGDFTWYGIVTSTSADQYGTATGVTLTPWLKVTNPDINGKSSYLSCYIFDGMFRGMDSITTDVNERFTVTENTYAQSIEGELFNYTTKYEESNV